MNRRGDTDTAGNNLDRYGDADEATIRRESASEAELEHYEEDDVATVPWLPR